MNADHVRRSYTNNAYLAAYPKMNWSPRLGAAYQIDNKTVARAGGGVFFGGFEPGGGAANSAESAAGNARKLAGPAELHEWNLLRIAISFNNTLEGGLGGFAGSRRNPAQRHLPRDRRRGPGDAHAVHRPTTT